LKSSLGPVLLPVAPAVAAEVVVPRSAVALTATETPHQWCTADRGLEAAITDFRAGLNETRPRFRDRRLTAPPLAGVMCSRADLIASLRARNKYG
jgi:hypothetical protein